MKKGLTCLVCCLVMIGCYSPRYVYSPAAHNVPFTSKKGDSKLALGYASNLTYKNREANNVWVNKASGLDVQAAYAITNKWIITGTYFGRREKNEGNFSFDNFDSSVIQYKRNLTEIGLGYNRAINESGSMYFQFYAGYGRGRFRFTDIGNDQYGQAYNRFHSAGVTKYFIQPVLTIKRSKYFIASLSSRFTAIKYRDINTDYSFEELDNYVLDSLSDAPVFFWEPAFVHAIGFKKLPGVFLEYQAGLSLLLNKRFVDARTFNFSIGIVFDWRAWKNRKNKKAVVEKPAAG